MDKRSNDYLDAEVYNAVTEHFRQDLREFFSRSNFFLFAESILLSVYLNTFLKKECFLSGWQKMSISFFGLFLSIIWFLVSLLSLHWIKRWREKVKKISEKYSQIKAYKEVEDDKSFWGRFRPEIITGWSFPLLFVFAWILTLFFN